MVFRNTSKKEKVKVQQGNWKISRIKSDTRVNINFTFDAEYL